MGNIFTIIGLILDIFGVWAIAYEIIWGMPKHVAKALIEHKLENEKWFLQLHESSIYALPEPPYNIAEKQDMLLEVREKHKSTITNLECEAKEIEAGHTIKSFWVAVFGLSVITIGFVLQVIGAS